MAKGQKWQVDFYSINQIHYRIKILVEGYEGSPTQLIGAPNTFQMQTKSGGNLWDVFRNRTGYLRIIDDGTVPDDIHPLVNTSHLCMLYKIVNNEEVFAECAYIQATSFSQDLVPASSNNTLELPLSSPLTTIRELDCTTRGTQQIVDILYYFLRSLDRCYTTLVWPCYDDTTSLKKYACLHPYASYDNYVSLNEDYVIDDDYDSRVIAPTWGSVIDGVLQSLGLIMREDGGTVWLHHIDVDNDIYYSTAISSLLKRGNNTGQAVYPDMWTMGTVVTTSNRDISDASPHDSRHKLKYYMPARRLIFKHDVAKFISGDMSADAMNIDHSFSMINGRATIDDTGNERWLIIRVGKEAADKNTFNTKGTVKMSARSQTSSTDGSNNNCTFVVKAETVKLFNGDTEITDDLGKFKINALMGLTTTQESSTPQFNLKDLTGHGISFESYRTGTGYGATARIGTPILELYGGVWNTEQPDSTTIYTVKIKGLVIESEEKDNSFTRRHSFGDSGEEVTIDLKHITTFYDGNSLYAKPKKSDPGAFIFCGSSSSIAFDEQYEKKFFDAMTNIVDHSREEIQYVKDVELGCTFKWTHGSKHLLLIARDTNYYANEEKITIQQYN